MFRELPPRGPDGPRPTTPDMVADAKHAGRMLRIFGAVGVGLGVLFMVVFGLALPAHGKGFGLLQGLGVEAAGLLAYACGWWLKARQMELFRNGDEARGEVVSVELDPMQRINQRNPWKLRYRFESGGAVHEGTMRYWTEHPPAGLEPGREVVVLHARGKPSRSLLWAAATPPLAKGATAKAGARVREVWQGPYVDGTAPDVEAEAVAEAEAEAVAGTGARARSAR